MISHRNRLFKRKKENPLNLKIKSTYNLFRMYKYGNKKGKKKLLSKIFQENLSNMKKTWKGIKNILNLNNCMGSQVTQLHYDRKNINTYKGIWQMPLIISLPKWALH